MRVKEAKANVPFRLTSKKLKSNNFNKSMMFTSDELNHFEQYGYVQLKDVFSKDIARSCREKVWELMNPEVSKTEQLHWPNKFPLGHVFNPEDGYPWNCVITERLTNAIRDICSTSCTEVNQNNAEGFGLGWWMITFPVSTGSWGLEGRWHIDGMYDFVRYPFSKEIGLVLVIYFSDVHESCGGTCVAEGSHKNVIKSLITAGLKGSRSKPLVESVLSELNGNIVELTGDAGDVIILHPLLIHARSKNFGPKNEDGVRFMCHPSVALQEHLNFNKPFTHMSVLEKSIVNAVSDDDVLMENLINITPENCKKYSDRNDEQGQVKGNRGDDDGDAVVDSEIFDAFGFTNFGRKKPKY
jgi:hypothetical protein